MQPVDDAARRAALTQSLKAAAAEAGFCFAAACPAVGLPGHERLREWILAGHAGEMEYIPRRLEAYRHPRSVLPGAVSLLMLGLNYATAAPAPGPVPRGRGRIARYAWGTRDYHDLIRERLEKLRAVAVQHWPGVHTRGVVDTAPLLEREFAALAGVGWQARNTMLIHPRAGSWFFLAALLLDVELEPDEPFATDHCGTCTACLDACPTQAIVAPRVLDATRCISYLTIELKGPVPRDMRPGIGDWLFGCDVCQEVCPWNRFASPTDLPELQPVEPGGLADLRELFFLESDAFRRRFRNTPLWRARRRGVLRNAAIVLGNQKDPAALPALERGLADPEPLVRGAAAWALGQLDHPGVRTALEARLAIETDETVRDECRLALEQLDSSAGGA